MDVGLVGEDQINHVSLEPLLVLILLKHAHQSEERDDCFVFVAQAESGDERRHDFNFLSYLIGHCIVKAEVLIYSGHYKIEENKGRVLE